MIAIARAFDDATSLLDAALNVDQSSFR